MKSLNSEKNTNNREQAMPIGRQAGFTLMEVIIMTMMVSVSLVGINKMYVQTSRDAREKINEVIAANLAQEMVEIVRAIRDYNYDKNLEACKSDSDPTDGEWEGAVDWDNGISSGRVVADSSDLNNYQVEAANSSNEGLCINLAASNPRYTKCSTGNANKKFERYAVINKGSSSLPGGMEEIDISVHVSWTSMGGEDREVVIKDRLFEWQQVPEDPQECADEEPNP